MPTLRIFISSPGDVAEERDKAKQVIAALERHYGGEVALLPVLWEDLAIPATASFQEGIEFVLSERQRIDIAVFILWSRLGSPLGAAITKRDGSSYLSGTEREFDLMLAAFEQSGGKIPVILAYTREDNEGFNERLNSCARDEEALEDLVRQRKLVKQFIRERFQDEQGRNFRAFHIYREAVGFAERLHVHLHRAVDEVLGLGHAAAIWTEAPYRSLEAFDISHAPIFCGRDEETCELLQRLRDQQAGGCAFVCIVGASGSGKSSLARAGVAATLMQRSFDDGVKEWRATVLIPGHAQGELFPALARCLAETLPELREGIGGLEKLAKCLEDQNHEAAGILLETSFKAAGDKLGGPLRLLLVLDQMEELWTDRSITPQLREKFLGTLEVLSRMGHHSVLATLRSDFYSQAQLSETFLRMKGGRGHFDLAPPGTAALQQIIVQPAHRAGLSFERDEHSGRTLDQRILEDAARDPSALPLLQYALAELYERRDEKQRLLTFAAYEAMGGVEGALGQRATEIFGELSSEAQATFEEILPLLISVDVAGEQNAVRRRAPLADLTSTPARRSLTETLIEARFLATDDEGSSPIATLAHEALLRRWDRITNWINTNRDLLRMRARVEQYHAMWEESGRDASRLLPVGLPLEEGKTLLSRAMWILHEKTRDFIVASASHATALALRRRRTRRIVVASLALLLVAAVLIGVHALRKERQARLSEQSATNARDTAERLIKSMLYDLRDRLTTIGRVDLLDEISLKAQEYYEQQAAIDRRPDSLVNLSTMHGNRGLVLSQQGRLDAARAAFQRSARVLRDLLLITPDDLNARNNLAITLENLGGVEMRDRKWDGAIACILEAAGIRAQIVKADPKALTYERQLAQTQIHLGEAFDGKEDKDAALKAYQAGLEIAERLVATHSPSEDVFNELQHDLMNCLARTGWQFLSREDTDTARRALLRAEEIARRLANGHPSFVQARLDLAGILLSLGDVYYEEKKWADARKEYEQRSAIIEAVAKGNSSITPNVLKNLESLTHDRLGDVAFRLGNTQEAADHYEKYLKACSELADADPKNGELQRNLINAYCNFTSIAIVRGDPRAEADSYAARRKIWKRILIGSPETRTFAGDLAWVCLREVETELKCNPKYEHKALLDILNDARIPLTALKQQGQLGPREIGLLAQIEAAYASYGGKLAAAAPPAASGAEPQPRAFRFIYAGNPDPGPRIWTRAGEVWEEHWPGGSVKRLFVVRRDQVDGISGTVAKEYGNEDFEVFVPDRNSKRMDLLARYGASPFKSFNAHMLDVE